MVTMVQWCLAVISLIYPCTQCRYFQSKYVKTGPDSSHIQKQYTAREDISLNYLLHVNCILQVLCIYWAFKPPELFIWTINPFHAMNALKQVLSLYTFQTCHYQCKKEKLTGLRVSKYLNGMTKG
jgi:hypothetical protein